MAWFRERLHPDLETGVRIERELYRGRTDYQDVLVFECPTFGRVLVLDGVIQTTERDEFVYHEMIAHPALVAHGAARRVLIVGGGDGGVLREVLKHPVERAVLVELDPQVVALSRRFLPSVGGGAFDDPRSQVVIADAARWVAGIDERFDVVIVDSPDPLGPAEVLFGAAFYRDCRRCLADRGLLVTQSGVPFVQRDELRTGLGRLAALFRHVGFYLAAVPLYTGGDMAFGWASADLDLAAVPADAIARRCAGLGLATGHYCAATHAAALAIPPWLAAAANPAAGR